MKVTRYGMVNSMGGHNLGVTVRGVNVLINATEDNQSIAEVLAADIAALGARCDIADLNAVSCDADACVPFENPEGLTLAEGHGGWWLTCNKTGFGYWEKSANKIMRKFAVRITDVDGARHGFHCVVDGSRKAPGPDAGGI